MDITGKHVAAIAIGTVAAVPGGYMIGVMVDGATTPGANPLLYWHWSTAIALFVFLALVVLIFVLASGIPNKIWNWMPWRQPQTIDFNPRHPWRLSKAEQAQIVHEKAQSDHEEAKRHYRDRLGQ